MKTKSLLLTAMLLVTSCFIGNVRATQDEADAEAQQTAEVLKEYGYSFRSYYNYGTLNEGQSDWVSTTFYQGLTYCLVAGGCSYAEDIDMAVYDENYNLVAQDNDASHHSITKFLVYSTGTFHIKITMYKASSAGVHWTLLYGTKY